jgi:NAD(P)-dependent dehydrogenase (short-subunit alcohol dehydrogenase family)
MLRNAWLMHSVTDWMGDDAIIVTVDDRVTGFNTLGDLTKITGRVSSIDDTNGYPEVVCTLACHNQREEPTAHGVVRVRLPSRTSGIPDYPEPPAEHGLLNFSAAKAGILGLTKAAAKELARHNIRVKAAQSGLIRTAMTESMRRERLGAADRRDHAVPCR